ncbi:type III secretion system translocon subunit SctE [Paludibacterium paludis]|uniref:Translocator protein BipB n=1 Tax=Paludibacterium paludis TaxID=1225769 RepID=A0A918P515_9NEIS|nr:type III secretion system translocon subunit SctE [Paludibacterium paludis]GGY23936.1 cell invasion protein SipB [Paludibacterium paludis]
MTAINFNINRAAVPSSLAKEAVRLTRSQAGSLVGEADHAVQHLLATFAAEGANDPVTGKRRANAPQLRSPVKGFVVPRDEARETPASTRDNHAGETAGREVSFAAMGDTGPATSASAGTQASASQTAHRDAASSLTELLAYLAKLVGATSVQTLQTNIGIFQDMMSAQVAASAAASLEYAAQVAAMNAASAQLQQDLDAAQQTKNALDQASQSATKAHAALDALSPKDKGYQDAKAKADAADAKVATLSSKYKDATDAVSLASKAADEASAKASAVLNLLDVGGMNRQSDSSLQGNLDAHRDAQSELVGLMARLSALIGDSNDENLKTQADIQQQSNIAREKDLEKQSSDYEAKVAKQEHLNKAMGCVGKILGALLCVIGAVAAVFSGGASLALFAVGLALTVADKICKKVTGTSFIEKAMEPLTKLMQKLASAISSLVTKALEAVGVPKDKAELAGSIIGGVVAALAVVAAMVGAAFVAKGAASKMAGVMTKTLEKTIGKLIPQVLKDVAEDAGAMVSKGFGRVRSFLGAGDEVSAQRMAKRAQMMHTGLNAASQVTQSGLEIGSADAGKKANDALANLKLYERAGEVLNDLFSHMLDTWQQQSGVMEDFLKEMSSVIANINQTGIAIAQKAAI